MRLQPRRIETVKTLEETAVRFFGSFIFTNPPKTSQSMPRKLSLSTLRFGPHRGTARAHSMAMLKKFENLNPQSDAGLTIVVAALNFETEVLEAKLPVLIEFWTPWSRPCQTLDSVLQELARELAGKVKVVKVNADDSLDLSLYYDIQSVPTLLYFVEGMPRFRIVGTATKDAILAKLKASGFADPIDTLVKEASGAGCHQKEN
jgi:thioredoxin 1